MEDNMSFQIELNFYQVSKQVQYRSLLPDYQGNSIGKYVAQ